MRCVGVWEWVLDRWHGSLASRVSEGVARGFSAAAVVRGGCGGDGGGGGGGPGGGAAAVGVGGAVGDAWSTFGKYTLKPVMVQRSDDMVGCRSGAALVELFVVARRDDTVSPRRTSCRRAARCRGDSALTAVFTK